MGNSVECLIVVRASILFGFSSVENIFEGTGNTFCEKSEHVNIFLKYTILMQDVMSCHFNDILSLLIH